MANLEMGDIPNNEKNTDDVSTTEKNKFVNGSSGDIEKNSEFEKKEIKNHFAGLTKQELLQYADDPFWVKLRSALLLLFWVIWFGMLASAILIIVLSPKCPDRPTTNILNGPAVYRVNHDFIIHEKGKGLAAISTKFGYIKNQVRSNVVLLDSTLVSSTSLGSLKSFIKKAHKNELKVVVEIDSKNISLNYVKEVMAVKADGIKFLGHSRELNKVINETSELENKHNAVFIADGIINTEFIGIDMQIIKDNILVQPTSLQYGKNVPVKSENYKALMMILMTQTYTPFISAGQEFGLDQMDWSILKSQKAIGAGVTNFELFARLNSLREEDTMKFGKTTDNSFNNVTKVYSFTRSIVGFPTYYIAVNLETTDQTIEFSNSDTKIFGEVVANTGNVNSELAIHETFTFGSIYLKSNSGIIIRELNAKS